MPTTKQQTFSKGAKEIFKIFLVPFLYIGKSNENKFLQIDRGGK